MDRHFVKGLALAGALLLWAPSAWALSPVKSFTPAWERGQSWEVKTSFRKMNEMDAKGADLWSAPVSFVYTVASKSVLNGVTSYTLHIAPKTSKAPVATDVVVAVDAAGRAVVQSVTATYPKRGKIVSETVDYASQGGDGPVFTEASVLPYDLPSFPLSKPTDLSGSGYVSAKKKYQRVQTHGGLRFAKIRSQLVKSVQGSHYVDGSGQDVRFEVEVDPSKVYPVDINEENTGRKVVQYWAEGRPWALYSESPSSKTWLVSDGR